jgi:hypothetical protein
MLVLSLFGPVNRDSFLVKILSEALNVKMLARQVLDPACGDLNQLPSSAWEIFMFPAALQ